MSVSYRNLGTVQEEGERVQQPCRRCMAWPRQWLSMRTQSDLGSSGRTETLQLAQSH